MTDFIKILYKVAPYLNYVAIIIGLFRWQYLNRPIRIFLLIILFGSVIGVSSTFLKNSNFLFYLNALLSVTLYGFFFQSVLKNIINTRYIWIGVALVWSLILLYLLQNGFNKFQTQVLIGFDIFMILFCGIYLSNGLKTVVKVRTPLFALISILFINFCFVLFVDLVSVFLYNYLSNSFFDLLWGHIIPIVNIAKVIGFSLVFWFSRYRSAASINHIPDL